MSSFTGRLLSNTRSLCIALCCWTAAVGFGWAIRHGDTGAAFTLFSVWMLAAAIEFDAVRARFAGMTTHADKEPLRGAVHPTQGLMKAESPPP